MLNARILFFLSLLSAAVPAQDLSCFANAGFPLTTRVAGRSEIVSQLIVRCTGGTPTPVGQPVPAFDVNVSLGANVTSRMIGSGGWTEALLLMEEPPAGNRLACGALKAPETAPGVCTLLGTGGAASLYDGSPGHPNVFQARITNSFTLTFPNVPLDPPGPAAERIFRIVNLRANSSYLAPLAPFVPGFLFANVSVPGIAVANSSLLVAFAFFDPELTLDVPSPIVSRTSAPAGAPVATLSYQEIEAGSFKPRTSAPYAGPDISPKATPQNILGVPYFAESSFYDPALAGTPARGNLALAGLADFGTRIVVEVIGLPTDANLAVPNAIEWKSSDDRLQGVARRIASLTRPFFPSGKADGIDPLDYDPSSGNRVAYYEVLMASPYIPEAIRVPVYPRFPLKAPTAIKAPDVPVSVRVYFGPTSADTSASRSSKVPRFTTLLPAPTPLFTLTN